LTEKMAVDRVFVESAVRQTNTYVFIALMASSMSSRSL
jgi:hypothetical protein